MITLERNSFCINIDRIIQRQSIIKYDYNTIHIKLNNTIIGYIVEYIIPKCKYTYIDIYILDKYRGLGYGTLALNIYQETNNINLGIISNDKSKNNFLMKNKFYLDQNQIYKNLYKYEGEING